MTVQTLAVRAYALLPDPIVERWAEGEPYRRFLHLLCRGAVSLELGVDGGLTSACMAAGASFHVGVDSKSVAKDAPPFRFPSFRFLFCDSLGAAEVVRGLLGNRRLDVVFQDSSHHAEPSRLEFEYYRPMLAPGAAWVCDDVTPAFRLPDEPRSMVEYFHSLPGAKLTFPGLHLGNVIGVVLP